MLKRWHNFLERFKTKTVQAAKGFRHGFMRSYAAAKTTRLELGWVTQPTTIIDDLKQGLRILRARSRESCQNNDYSKRWVCLLEENVVGDMGIKLQADPAIEAAWKAWGKKGVCDVTGTLSWIDAQKFWLKATARDGEILVRLVRSPTNGFGLALQFLEVDRMDETHFETLSNGNTISMGVERDGNLRPVAYHLRTPGRQPGSFLSNIGPTERIPADEVIHGGIHERADQPRYAPWNSAALIRLQFLSGYEEAEIVAARSASCKMGVLEQDQDATGEYTGDKEDVEGHPTIEAAPGTFPSLPPGYHLKPWDPTHPTTAFKDFMKAVLRGIASGLNTSYHALTSDLESVSFSSLRAGELKERDTYRSTQRFMIETFCERVFEKWVSMASLLGQIPLNAAQVEAGVVHTWQPRGWAWVDPLKDINANIMAIQHGLGSRTMFLAERGLDYEEIMAQLAKENELAQSLGLNVDGSAAEGDPTDDEPEDQEDRAGGPLYQKPLREVKNG